MYGKMRKSLGSKRKELRQKDIERICHLYDSYASLTQGLKRPPTQRWALGVMTPTPPNLWGMATKFGHRLA